MKKILLLFMVITVSGTEKEIKNNKETLVYPTQTSHHHHNITISIDEESPSKIEQEEKKCLFSPNMKIAILTSASSVISAIISGIIVKYSNQC